MPEVVDIRGLTGNGLLCQLRTDTQRDEGEISIKDHRNGFVLITFRRGGFSINYYPDDPFRARTPQ